MKSTKKIVLAAGILFQLSASMYADNWSDAFLAFGGSSDPVTAAQNVLASQGKESLRSALNIAVNKLGSSEEGMAVASWMSNAQSNAFQTSYQASDVQAAAQALAASVRNMPMQAPVAAPSQAQVPTQTKAGSSWFSWGSATPTSTPADIQAAMLTQQQADAAKAAADLQSLSAIVNSNASGVSLYNAYVDVIVNNLQQALSSIADPAVQQQVVSYAKNKLSNMQASVSVNSNNSRALGRMSSKKAMKKNKHSRSYAA